MRGAHLEEVEGDVEQLLGSGQTPTASQRSTIVEALQRRLADAQAPGFGGGWSAVWIPEQLEGTLVYQHADKGSGGDTFKSLLYRRAARTVSYYALVQYEDEGGGGEESYVAEVQLFAKVEAATREAAEAAAEAAAERAAAAAAATARRSGRRGGRGGRRRQQQQPGPSAAEQPGAAPAEPIGEQPAPLRMAVCNMYKAVAESSWRGDAYTVKDMQRPTVAGTCLPLGELGQKLAACLDARMPSSGSHAGMFIPYANLSNSGVL
jgi:hypothetical protein